MRLGLTGSPGSECFLDFLPQVCSRVSAVNHSEYCVTALSWKTTSERLVGRVERGSNKFPPRAVDVAVD